MARRKISDWNYSALVVLVPAILIVLSTIPLSLVGHHITMHEEEAARAAKTVRIYMGWKWKVVGLERFSDGDQEALIEAPDGTRRRIPSNVGDGDSTTASTTMMRSSI